MSRNNDILRRRGIDLMRSWREDWNRFVRDGLGVTLDREQQEILSSVQFNPRTSVASGTARGKDFVAACAAISFLYLTPRWNTQRQLIENTKVALTAPTDRQVKNIMMPEISRLYNRAKSRGIVLPGRLNAYDIRTDSDEWFLTGFKADENNHEAWSGFHAVNTMFVITEASGISDNTFEAIEGNLQGNSRVLLVFNPNTPIGYAARSQRGERWTKFRLNSLTAPNVIEHKIIIPGQVDYEWVVDKLEQWCTRIDKSEVQEELDAPEWFDAQFTGCDAIVPRLNTLLTDVEDLPRINELAQALQELKASGLLTKFKAVVGATQCETLDDVFDRIEKLPQYCFETKIRDKDALVRDELEFVLGGRDADLIYKHLNREAYAEDVLKQYGAEITPYGMVNREDFGPLHEPISEQQQEQTQEPQMGM